jgi:hypothetical protein
MNGEQEPYQFIDVDVQIEDFASAVEEYIGRHYES